MHKNFLENSFVYSIGSFGYAILEIIWRGYTHWTMAITGGICFLLIYRAYLKLINRNIVLRCLAGAIIVTAIEFIVGSIVNLELKWDVWDYSSQPFNILGQVCGFYSLMWFFICFPLNPLCKFIKKYAFSN